MQSSTKCWFVRLKGYGTFPATCYSIQRLNFTVKKIWEQQHWRCLRKSFTIILTFICFVWTWIYNALLKTKKSMLLLKEEIEELTQETLTVVCMPPAARVWSREQPVAPPGSGPHDADSGVWSGGSGSSALSLIHPWGFMELLTFHLRIHVSDMISLASPQIWVIKCSCLGCPCIRYVKSSFWKLKWCS